MSDCYVLDIFHAFILSREAYSLSHMVYNGFSVLPRQLECPIITLGSREKQKEENKKQPISSLNITTLDIMAYMHLVLSFFSPSKLKILSSITYF